MRPTVIGKGQDRKSITYGFESFVTAGD